MRKQRVENPQELINDYKSGMLVVDLAKKYDLSKGGVYYYLRVYGANRDRYDKNKPKVNKEEKIRLRKDILRARREALIDFIFELKGG